MAKKDEEKKDEAQATPETALEQAAQPASAAPAAEVKNEAQNAAKDGGVPRSASDAATALAASEGECRTGCAVEPNGLESLGVLADRHRVPSWQQAALLRYAGWADDKLVTEAEYAEALEGLKNRRIGGGRR